MNKTKFVLRSASASVVFFLARYDNETVELTTNKKRASKFTNAALAMEARNTVRRLTGIRLIMA